ncbi:MULTISPECIES: glycosyltransferase [unclassified Devosia]|uniref:glycosyltransferase n=1 Tax=unclassified Devosia TaxID=196773 RepID=UPI001557C0CC|nr:MULTISPECIES: glycosyltransferase [unclassified Devosia]
MKILVFAHKLEVGGTQVNAIELAAQMRDAHGHDVVLFAVPGPMVALVEDKGLRYIPAPTGAGYSPSRMRALYRLAQAERPDLIHVWDAPQYLEAMFAVHLWTRVPMVVTSMAMVVNNEFPRHIRTTFGTPDLVAQAVRSGRRASPLLPPVDTDFNQPDPAQGQDFRDRHSFSERDIVLVTVSRLVHWMKAESLRDTIEAVRTLGHDLPLHFVIVGDGTARPEIEALSEEVNRELGRTAVHVIGPMLDPRPAYAAADIVIGMGGSALRGMAFAKPVIVVGEQGFSGAFTPETAPSFLQMGIYGLGDGQSGRAQLTRHIAELAAAPERLAELGAFGRAFVTRNFSLAQVASDLHQLMADCVVAQPSFGQFAADMTRTTALFVAHRLLPYQWRARLSWAKSRHRQQLLTSLQFRGQASATFDLPTNPTAPSQGAGPPA